MIENENINEETEFNDFTPEQIGETEAEVTDLINQTQELIEKCEEVLGGKNNE